ncbi:MAG: rhomboid family intramembrane serine protease [Rhizobiales bacterium]|nr:rhomboid family intramembrane serine protease [Hyphomicrobiales bacterium]
MFVPLHDTNPLEHIKFQFMTILIIVANVVIFVMFQSGIVYPVNEVAMASFAIVPAELLPEGLTGPNIPGEKFDLIPISEKFTLITYMFLHGGWLHLGGNMLFLWVFGDNIEDAMGHFTFLIFYLLCGIVAGYTHSIMAPNSEIPLIGASGAVAGVIAAYLMLHPRVKLWVLVLGNIPLPVNAAIAILAWFVFQIFHIVYMDGGNTAWWAHIGGFLAGLVLIVFMKRREVPLFDRN